ncbi:MAG: hypothetical protein K0U47_04100 [Epsilonproteobacteria bacterium]|nr:hypothetical protein [Campylobacterota bacterium]
MRIKFILTSLLFTLFLTGCQVTAVDHISYNSDEISRYDAKMMISQVLQSQTRINEASIDNLSHYSYLEGILEIIYDDDSSTDMLSINTQSNYLILNDPYYYTKTYLTDLWFDYTFDYLLDEYAYSYSGTLKNAQIGWLSFETISPFYGLSNENPYYGSLGIRHQNGTLYLDVVDNYYIDITLYDRYHEGYYDQFRTTWHALGF